MTTVLRAKTKHKSFADFMRRIGDVPLDRVRFHPAPGTATVRDVIEIEERENKLCELIDGALVEKAMGYPESLLALRIGTLLSNFVVPHKLGLVAGSDGMLQIIPGLVRIPDVSFIKPDRIRRSKSRTKAVPRFSPNLAVEVLSESNTPSEMKIKRREYFASGTELVWEVDPKKRTVTVYTSPTRHKTFTQDEELRGDPVLPGFSIPIISIFEPLDQLESILNES